MSVLARIAQGDNTAFTECIDRYGGLVWSLARKMTRNAADAEDATQEIFLTLWKHASRFDPQKGSEATFIATIARRSLIDRLRQRQRRPVEVPMDDLEPLAWVAPSNGENSLEASRAATALAALRPEQQQVISLAVVEGLSQSEIAAQTGMPLGTVKTLMRRGLLAIRALLGEVQS
ncbi:RNA polymerase sigma-70 factor (ECF subfamily) [Povalibacter uvarum]|uniref:RNA polymerase sigma-70 factor (ECF subfamily) n=1 Tax=Povalibacter uvarum TaxID=732238 RepID=A0A841HIJ7_9GAMM|nr:sigma-70 family RNA polymerase sigma factor [Povalibacter uvarum]MBB6092404.1 RNA polymerase sigma-70 factor (ECF subfamily) [Povalibacter uvarum]